MSITVQPQAATDATGAALVPAISTTGQVQVANDDLRRIQEIILIHQQASLFSIQLAGEKTARYTFLEVR